MSREPRPLPEVTLYIGDLHVSARPVVVRTLLGSCIAACLWDPVARVGGMNHFMLPRSPAAAGEESSRFGIHAMELLIAALAREGGNRRRLLAKVFGGGHVLGLPEASDSVPRQNVAFVVEFCRRAGVEIVAQDLGGHAARQVRFRTDSGQAWVRRLRGASAGVLAAEAAAGDGTLY